MASPKLRNSPEGHPLYVRCGECGHGARLELAELVRMLGDDATFDDLRSRLRCSWCGGRKAGTVLGSAWGPRSS